MEEFFYAEDLYGLQREVGGANKKKNDGIQLNTMSCTKAIANSAAVLSPTITIHSTCSFNARPLPACNIE